MFDLRGHKQQSFQPDRDYIPVWIRNLLSHIKEVLWAAVAPVMCGFILAVLLAGALAVIRPPASLRAPSELLDALYLLLFVSIPCGFAYFRFCRGNQGKWSTLAWILPAIWLVFGILSDYPYRYTVQEHWWRYVWDNYFGENCGGSECLGELFFTAPFYSSVAYSITSGLLHWKCRNSAEPPIKVR
ncbi:MAG: hypothetical protein ACYDDI_00440 [Candidatus Acidiferrales bacterium]